METDEEGSFLLLDGELAGHDAMPLTLFPEADQKVLGEAVARSLGFANAAAQAATGFSQAMGLVRLAPETVSLLKSGVQPLTKDGWNLGTLMSEGKFARQVRWLPAGSAGAVQILAAVGPAATLIAIQWQLAQMSRLIEKNIALTNAVLQLVRREQWAEVRGQHDAILAELGHAQAVGQVTPQIWNHAQAQASEANLRKNMLLFFENVQGHARGLSNLAGAKSRQEWIRDYSEAALRDVDALLMAHRAWFVYQSLRAAQLNATANDNPRDKELQTKLVKDARAMHDQVLAACEPLLESVYRHFRLMEACPGGMGLSIKNRKSTPGEVTRAAGVLATQIAQLRGTDWEDPSSPQPLHGWLDVTKTGDQVSERLKWLLDPGERLLSVGWGSTSYWDLFTDGYVAFTDRRALLLKNGAFLKEGKVDREVLWSDVHSVRCSEGTNIVGGPDLVVEGTGGKFRVEFYRAVSREDVRHLAKILHWDTAIERR